MKFQSHDKYLDAVATERVQRAKEITVAVSENLARYVVTRPAQEVHLAKVRPEELAALLLKEPKILKPLIAACNMGKRALRKDLGLELDTFRPKLTPEDAQSVSEYLLRSLPKAILIECLAALDSYQWTDSAVRKKKGRWERQFVEQLRKRGVACKKRKFVFEGDQYELDIAYPVAGEINLAVDVKMIGHPSDKHKRGDEIVNKAAKFKKVFSGGRFIALLYYPFQDRTELEHRLKSGQSGIDEVAFAGDDQESVEAAVQKIYQAYKSFS